MHPYTKTRSTKDTEEDLHKDDLLLARATRPTSLLQYILENLHCSTGRHALTCMSSSVLHIRSHSTQLWPYQRHWGPSLPCLGSLLRAMAGSSICDAAADVRAAARTSLTYCMQYRD